MKSWYDFDNPYDYNEYCARQRDREEDVDEYRDREPYYSDRDAAAMMSRYYDDVTGTTRLKNYEARYGKA